MGGSNFKPLRILPIRSAKPVACGFEKIRLRPGCQEIPADEALVSLLPGSYADQEDVIRRAKKLRS